MENKTKVKRVAGPCFECLAEGKVPPNPVVPPGMLCAIHQNENIEGPRRVLNRVINALSEDARTLESLSAQLSIAQDKLTTPIQFLVGHGVLTEDSQNRYTLALSHDKASQWLSDLH